MLTQSDPQPIRGCSKAATQHDQASMSIVQRFHCAQVTDDEMRQFEMHRYAVLDMRLAALVPVQYRSVMHERTMEFLCDAHAQHVMQAWKLP